MLLSPLVKFSSKANGRNGHNHRSTFILFYKSWIKIDQNNFQQSVFNTNFRKLDKKKKIQFLYKNFSQYATEAANRGDKCSDMAEYGAI
jgi:hypothetical protein